ncbi:MAG: biopolymer transporter ExbD [Syntrophorhabdaceae bacterium]|nr:biopolymer transporter ExbD [Syntrophorhabdaceae bacterium]
MEEKEFSYINMIPFIDVMLVLLVIVLMTGTFVATGIIPVELPKVSRIQERVMKTGVIEIDKDGVVYYQTKRIELEGLKVALTGTSRDTPFLIRADRDIQLQRFVEVLETVKSMGFRKVSLQTEEAR